MLIVEVILFALEISLLSYIMQCMYDVIQLRSIAILL